MRIWHHCRCTKISSVRKSANARVRNFYAYENFCDYSSLVHCTSCIQPGDLVSDTPWHEMDQIETPYSVPHACMLLVLVFVCLFVSQDQLIIQNYEKFNRWRFLKSWTLVNTVDEVGVFLFFVFFLYILCSSWWKGMRWLMRTRWIVDTTAPRACHVFYLFIYFYFYVWSLFLDMIQVTMYKHHDGSDQVLRVKFEVPASAQVAFGALCNANTRPQWDLLCRLGPSSTLVDLVCLATMPELLVPVQRLERVEIKCLKMLVSTVNCFLFAWAIYKEEDCCLEFIVAGPLQLGSTSLELNTVKCCQEVCDMNQRRNG